MVFWASLPVQALLSRSQIFLVAAFSEKAALAPSCGAQPGVTRQ